LTVGLLIEIIIVKELGMLNPAARRFVCRKEADPRFFHPLVLKVKDEDGSDLSVRQLDVLPGLLLHVLPGLALRDLAYQRG
jgi:hypothetical protein